MNVLMIARRARPAVGGVETHIEEVSKILGKKHTIRLVTEKDIGFPHIPALGLLFIWLWFLKNKRLVEKADLVHVHDVFIWYLPLRFLFPKKPVYVTFHGWEGKFPVHLRYKWIRQISARLAWGNICVGKYIEKWYGIKATYITYGAVSNFPISNFHFPINLKNPNFKIVYIGRLEEDTGLLIIFDILQLIKPHFARASRGKEKKTDLVVEFLGDGSLRAKCEQYGRVHGFKKNIGRYLARADLVFVSGYLSALEALSFGKNVLAVSENALKYDYWHEFCSETKPQSWSEVARLYLKLWKKK